MLRQPRLLIIEDIEDILADLRGTFSRPPPEFTNTCGIDCFHVDTALCGREARAYLTSAMEQLLPYDVVVLDLGLPMDPGGTEDKAVGLELLHDLQNDERYRWACGATVIESIYTDVPTFVELLRSGAADFVPKPFQVDVLFRSVVHALEKTKMRAENNWRRYQRARDQWLVASTCLQVPDSMAKIVSGGISTVLTATRRVADLLEEHYQLNTERDADHAICGAIREIRVAANEIAAKCAAERESLSVAPRELELIVVDRVLRAAIEDVRPGFYYRHLRLDLVTQEVPPIRTFGCEVRLLLQELLYSAIEASTEGSRICVEVGCDSRCGIAFVRVTDEGEALPEEVRAKVERGRLTLPIDKRGWGLALAQMGALNIGARIEIGSAAVGNTITIRFPLPSDEISLNH